jgi:hypothetical protein
MTGPTPIEKITAAANAISPADQAKADAAYLHTNFVAAAEAMVPIVAAGLDQNGIEPSPLNVAQVMLVAVNLIAARSPGGVAEAKVIMDQMKRQAITSLRILDGKPVSGGLILPGQP